MNTLESSSTCSITHPGLCFSLPQLHVSARLPPLTLHNYHRHHHFQDIEPMAWLRSQDQTFGITWSNKQDSQPQLLFCHQFASSHSLPLKGQQVWVSLWVLGIDTRMIVAETYPDTRRKGMAHRLRDISTGLDFRRATKTRFATIREQLNCISLDCH